MPLLEHVLPLEALQESDQPELFFVLGQPAAGVSHVARELGRTLKAPVLNQAAHLESVTGEYVPAGASARALDWLCDVLGYYLLQGQRVILDSQGYTAYARQPFLQVARTLGIPVYGIWVQCPDPASREVFQELRGYSPALLEAIQLVFEPPQVSEGFLYITGYANHLDLPDP